MIVIPTPKTLEDVVILMNENGRRAEENFKTIAKEIDRMNEEIEKLKGKQRLSWVGV